MTTRRSLLKLSATAALLSAARTALPAGAFAQGTGPETKTAKLGYIALMDVLVHLSLREGLPRTLPQAMAGGKPVVAFDVDGAREVCLPDWTGVLLRPGDVAGLGAAVIRLLRDPEQAHTMGARGRALVSAQFTEERMVTAIDELYRRCALARAT